MFYIILVLGLNLILWPLILITLSLLEDFKKIPVIDVSPIALTSSRPTAGDYQQVAASLAQALVGFIYTFWFFFSSSSYILDWNVNELQNEREKVLMKPSIVHLGLRLLDPSWDSSKHHQRLLQTIKELLQTPSTSQRQIQVSLLNTMQCANDLPST